MGFPVYCLSQCLALKTSTQYIYKISQSLEVAKDCFKKKSFKKFGTITNKHMPRQDKQKCEKQLKKWFSNVSEQVCTFCQDLGSGELLGDPDPDDLQIGLSDLANKTIGALIKPEFQINS